MKNVDYYLDCAKARNGYTSDRQLGAALGKSGTTVNQYRTKRTWPSDNTMVTLAELADEDQFEALANLNMWRSPGRAHAVYEKMAAALAGVSLAILFIFVPGEASAAWGILAEQTCAALDTIYIMENYIKRVLRQWFRRIISTSCNYWKYKTPDLVPVFC